MKVIHWTLFSLLLECTTFYQRHRSNIQVSLCWNIWDDVLILAPSPNACLDATATLKSLLDSSLWWYMRPTPSVDSPKDWNSPIALSSEGIVIGPSSWKAGTSRSCLFEECPSLVKISLDISLHEIWGTCTLLYPAAQAHDDLTCHMFYAPHVLYNPVCLWECEVSVRMNLGPSAF